MVGSAELSPTHEKRGGKKEGRILPSFLFSSSIFLPRSTIWTRQANQDMISFRIYNHWKPIGINPAGAKSDMSNA